MHKYMNVEVDNEGKLTYGLNSRAEHELGLFTPEQVNAVLAFLHICERDLEVKLALSSGTYTPLDITGNTAARARIKIIRSDFAALCEKSRKIKAMEDVT